jgi:hypothetical protein
MNQISRSLEEHLLLLLCVGVGLRLAPAALKGLLDSLLRRALRKIDSATDGQPAVRRALRQQVDNTPGWLLKLLVARALLKTRRKPRSERLAGLFLDLGAAVIGGDLGQDHKRQWIDDLEQGGIDGKMPVILLVNAFSCFLGSPQLLWAERINPGLRRRFARQYRIGGLFLTAAERSWFSAFFLIALPATPALTFAGYMIGYIVGFNALGWALAACVIIEVPHRTHCWQRERQIAADTRKAAGN